MQKSKAAGVTGESIIPENTGIPENPADKSRREKLGSHYDKLRLAVPSKGRIKEMTFDFFESCGLPIQAGGDGRGYTGCLKGLPEVELLFFRPDEIPGQLEIGSAHLGVTGEDLYKEHTGSNPVSHMLIRNLGYGHARVVVAVPRAWIDVDSIEDIEEISIQMRHRHGRSLRVATGFTRLARKFFADKGIADYRIVQSLGATEGAPAAGTADIIVDITSTGTTLTQNHLKMISGGTLLSSQVCLFMSLEPAWKKAQREMLREITDRIEAHQRAKDMYVLRSRAKRGTIKLFSDFLKEFQLEQLEDFSSVANDQETVEFTIYCPNERMYRVVDKLREKGCNDIIVNKTDYIFSAPNKAYERFRHLLAYKGEI